MGGEPGLPAHTVLPQVLPIPSHRGRKSNSLLYELGQVQPQGWGRVASPFYFCPDCTNKMKGSKQEFFPHSPQLCLVVVKPADSQEGLPGAITTPV